MIEVKTIKYNHSKHYIKLEKVQNYSQTKAFPLFQIVLQCSSMAPLNTYIKESFHLSKVQFFHDPFMLSLQMLCDY